LKKTIRKIKEAQLKDRVKQRMLKIIGDPAVKRGGNRGKRDPL
jgi:hypothetical protein